MPYSFTYTPMFAAPAEPPIGRPKRDRKQVKASRKAARKSRQR